jgi:hypothetical protein
MPKTCCSCRDDKHRYPISSDTCMCGESLDCLSTWCLFLFVNIVLARRILIFLTNGRVFVLASISMVFKNRNTPGCAYLNGWVAILGVQLLALIGMLFSIAAMGDCSFMELEERLFFPPDLDENLPLKVTQTQYVGFLTWKMLDGYVLMCMCVFLLSFQRVPLCCLHLVSVHPMLKTCYFVALSCPYATTPTLIYSDLATFTSTARIRLARYQNSLIF